MKRLGFWLVLCVGLLIVGCSDGGSSSGSKGPAPSAESAKAALNEMAKNGRIGSGMMTVDSYIGSLRKSDASKGEAVSKDFEELKKLGSKPDALKAKAKELADKL
jgi:hypothetical protein